MSNVKENKFLRKFVSGVVAQKELPKRTHKVDPEKAVKELKGETKEKVKEWLDKGDAVGVYKTRYRDEDAFVVVHEKKDDFANFSLVRDGKAVETLRNQPLWDTSDE